MRGYRINGGELTRLGSHIEMSKPPGILGGPDDQFPGFVQTRVAAAVGARVFAGAGAWIRSTQLAELLESYRFAVAVLLRLRAFDAMAELIERILFPEWKGGRTLSIAPDGDGGEL